MTKTMLKQLFEKGGRFIKRKTGEEFVGNNKVIIKVSDKDKQEIITYCKVNKSSLSRAELANRIFENLLNTADSKIILRPPVILEVDKSSAECKYRWVAKKFAAFVEDGVIRPVTKGDSEQVFVIKEIEYKALKLAGARYYIGASKYPAYPEGDDRRACSPMPDIRSIIAKNENAEIVGIVSAMTQAPILALRRNRIKLDGMAEGRLY